MGCQGIRLGGLRVMKTFKEELLEEQQVAYKEGCWGFRASLSFRRKRQGQAAGRKGEGRLGRLFWPRVSDCTQN